jgi:hypothetical protein
MVFLKGGNLANFLWGLPSWRQTLRSMVLYGFLGAKKMEGTGTGAKVVSLSVFQYSDQSAKKRQNVANFMPKNIHK